jgi:hypothetical protein
VTWIGIVVIGVAAVGVLAMLLLGLLHRDPDSPARTDEPTTSDDALLDLSADATADDWRTARSSVELLRRAGYLNKGEVIRGGAALGSDYLLGVPGGLGASLWVFTSQALYVVVPPPSERTVRLPYGEEFGIVLVFAGELLEAEPFSIAISDLTDPIADSTFQDASACFRKAAFAAMTTNKAAKAARKMKQR